MRNYQESDYALNKYSEGIVYKFADGIVEVTLADYLRDNPDKTAEDFAKLKALSDELYHEQDLDETAYGKRARKLDWLAESEEYATPSVDITLIHNSDKGQALKAAKRLLESGKLTEVQRRRFLLHYFKGLSIRQIAGLEQVDYRAVWESLHWSTKKLKKFYEE
ncbi:RNA polymerase subunit sigma-24 [Enterocloster sp. OA13]|uniref:sigma factor-like helix-turn-helix DNA-binding protein n=1 Tax=Enterocloster sp. OA13 TaxID=2914161 RepID=UPI000472A4CC|nr:RNA polymerase subunit sigma-24 [Enterocloster sp. OA13]